MFGLNCLTISPRTERTVVAGLALQTTFNYLLSFREMIVLALLIHLACFTTKISPVLATQISFT